VPAYIQKSIAKNFDPRCPASGLIFKENPPTATAVDSSVGDQRCGIGRRAILKNRLAPDSTASSGTIVNEGAISGARGEIEEVESKFGEAALCTAGRGSIVNKGAISRG
jgi:hypothetical protein